MIPIKNYEDRYLIYVDGRVKSLISNRFLTLQKIRSGYLRVTLYNGNGYKRFLVHRLVAESFLPKQDGQTVVNHKDGNKENNKTSNLEWVTPSQNAIHAIDNNLYKRSKRGKCPSLEIKEKIKSMAGLPINRIAVTLGLNRKSVQRVINKEKGFTTNEPIFL